MNILKLIGEGESKTIEFTGNLFDTLDKTILFLQNNLNFLYGVSSRYGLLRSIKEVPNMTENDQLRPNNAEYDRIRPITTEYDRIIIEYIKKYSAVNRSEAKVLLGIGETKIKEVFNGLIEKDLIRRVGAGRSTHYILREHFDGEEG